MEHLLGTGSNIPLQHAFLLYGKNTFVFLFIEQYNFDFEQSIEENRVLLLAMEQHYLDLLSPRYNILKVAGSPLGSKMSAEAKAKISAARKATTLSPDHRDKFAGTGAKNHRFGKTAPNAVKVYIYSLDDQLIKEFPSLKTAAEWFGVSTMSIHNYLKSGKQFKGEYILRNTLV